jgi:hypothetical protein
MFVAATKSTKTFAEGEVYVQTYPFAFITFAKSMLKTFGPFCHRNSFLIPKGDSWVTCVTGAGDIVFAYEIHWKRKEESKKLKVKSKKLKENHLVCRHYSAKCVSKKKLCLKFYSIAKAANQKMFLQKLSKNYFKNKNTI